VDGGRLRYGFWRAEAANPALLASQLVVFFNAANRGTDYLTARDDPSTALAEVVAAASLQVWGWLFYGLAVLGVVGLALRHIGPVIVAHLGLFALYGGLGASLLGGAGIRFTPLAWLGVLVGAAGAWLVWTERVGLAARFCFGLPLMLMGQLALTGDLGPDYRTGLGLVGGALLHVILAAGTVVAWLRQRLGPLVDPNALPGDLEREQRRAS